MAFLRDFNSLFAVGLFPGAINCTVAHTYGPKLTPMYCERASWLLNSAFDSAALSRDIFPVESPIVALGCRMGFWCRWRMLVFWWCMCGVCTGMILMRFYIRSWNDRSQGPTFRTIAVVHGHRVCGSKLWLWSRGPLSLFYFWGFQGGFYGRWGTIGVRITGCSIGVSKPGGRIPVGVPVTFETWWRLPVKYLFVTERTLVW